MNFLVRDMEINRDGQQNPLSSKPQKISEFSLSYNRRVDLGQVSIGLVYSHLRERGVRASKSSTVEWWAGFQTN